MSYEVTWSEGTKEALETAFPDMKPTERREWFIAKVIDTIKREIALYPQNASAQPGQHVTAELAMGTFRVRYEIRMDTAVAIVTEVKAR